MNDMGLYMHFNTDVNFNKHKLWRNKPKAYDDPRTYEGDGKINSILTHKQENTASRLE